MKQLIGLFAITAMSACVGTAPVSPNASPGAQPASPRMAAQIFNDACVQTLPNLAGAPQAIAAYPMTQHATFGTYYHNQQNLSVKLIGADCSIVFEPNITPAAALVGFGIAVGADTNPVTIRLSPGPAGSSYINARTTASQ